MSSSSPSPASWKAVLLIGLGMVFGTLLSSGALNPSSLFSSHSHTSVTTSANTNGYDSLVANSCKVSLTVVIGALELLSGHGKIEHLLYLIQSIHAPVVVYAPEEYHRLILTARGSTSNSCPILFVNMDEEYLRTFPFFNSIEAVRLSSWKDSKPWIKDSPQGQSAIYNSFQFSKMVWLHEVAGINPFGTENFAYVDEELSQCDIPSQDALSKLLAKSSDKFFAAAFSYTEGDEVHGFPRKELATFSGVTSNQQVVKGLFFGGERDVVMDLYPRYLEVMKHTLQMGVMGVEDNLFMILYERFKDHFLLLKMEAGNVCSVFRLI